MAKMSNEERAEILAKTIFDDEPALSVVDTEIGKSIVRPMTDGRFAVIALAGAQRRAIKALPTKEKAIAYNRACAF